MGRKCCVPGCTGNYEKNGVCDRVSVFQFPKDPTRKDLWLSKIPRKDFTPSKESVVCARHFIDNCIVRVDSFVTKDGELIKVKRSVPKLTRDAVPTLFPSIPEDTPLKRKTLKAKQGKAAKDGLRNIGEMDQQPNIEEMDQQPFPDGAPLKREEAKDGPGNIGEVDQQPFPEGAPLIIKAEKDGPGNVGEMDQQPFQDLIETDRILDFSEFCRELNEKKKDGTWMAKLYENDSQSYYSFYQFNDLPDSKPSLSSAIRIFSDMKVEVFVNLNTSACLDPVPTNSLEWLFGNRSCPILSAWVQFDSLLSYFSTISAIYSVNDVQVKEEFTGNSETDNVADDDNDDSDEQKNSADTEIHAEGLAFQASYKRGYNDGDDESERKQNFNNYIIYEDRDADHFEREESSNSDEMQLVGDADQSEWKQKLSSGRIADVVDVEQEERMQSSNIDESKQSEQTPKEGYLQKSTTQAITEKQQSRDQFGCQFCRKVFAHSNVRDIHMKIYHKDQYFLPTVNVEKDQSESGQQRQKPFTCDRCKKSFTTKYSLKYHTYSNKCSSKDKSVICEDCGSLCKDKRSLNVHIKAVHIKPHKCPECQQGFGNVTALKRHIRVHRGEKPFQCTSCTSAFTAKSDLVKHQRIHTGEKPYTCDICNKSFCRLSNMTAHKKIHSRAKSHRASPRERGTAEKKFMCELCGEAFGHQNGLILHQLKHTGKKPYSCDICGREFYSKYYVKLHKIIHTGKSSFQCSYCNRAFQNSYALKIHARRHTGERPYKCEDCNRAFFCRTDYNRHRETHSGLKPYTCEICNKSFKTKRNYWPHKRRHTDKRQFQCEICSKFFKDKSTLRKHAKIHLRAQEQLWTNSQTSTG